MEPRAGWRQHPLVRRLPPLLLILVGLYAWQTGFVPKERELVWTVEGSEALRLLEVQLYDEDDALVKREELRFPQGTSTSMVQQVRLGSGRYRAEVFTRYANDDALHHSTHRFEVTGEPKIVVRVSRSR